MALRSALADMGAVPPDARPSTLLRGKRVQMYDAYWAALKLTPTMQLKIQDLGSVMNTDVERVLFSVLATGAIVCFMLSMPATILFVGAFVFLSISCCTREETSTSYVLSGVETLGDLSRLVLYHRQAADDLG